ncbi:MAG: DUF655 domain-containing protein [Halobacteria archaeon]
MADKYSDEEYIYILDYLPGGHSRDRVSDDPIIQGVGEEEYGLYEASPKEDERVNIGEFVYIGDDEREKVDTVDKELEYDDLTSGAKKELEYGIEAILERNSERYVDFFNDAGSITIRMHQFDLLPGVGDKIRNSILDERKYEEFESFEDIEERISGFYDPKGTLKDRIIEEIKNEDMKYRLFVG